MVFLIQFTMFVTALFLIVLILLQRGRGGGLAGALGGMGGQSAFGSKAGDVFTRVTSGVAIFWILLCIGSLKYMSSTAQLFSPTSGAAAAQQQAETVGKDQGGKGEDDGKPNSTRDEEPDKKGPDKKTPVEKDGP
ncbi:MAG TPA: preprotein translocase subunit SecG [Pirellulales bacterium]|jgi:preprotein translocase subunit SecG|nr:preprotein translocase subunit SecG [Pirellulales bacterium]